jgi:hypothetical protein
MEWFKNNGITLLILIFLGFLVLKSFFPSQGEGIEYRIQKQLDSAKALIVEKNTENKFLLMQKEEAESEKMLLITSIKEQLMQIQPKYVQIMTDYKKATPEQKSKIINDEYERRKKEINSNKNESNN